MATHALIQELEQKSDHLRNLVSFLQGGYDFPTPGRLGRIDEALDIMKDIVKELRTGVPF